MPLHFPDRQAAGEKLAEALKHYKEITDVVVYALPRGGVIPARVVADALGAPLTLALAKKIGHPDNPEFAIGAVTEEGEPFWDEVHSAMFSEQWKSGAVAEAREEARRQRVVFLEGEKPLRAEGKTALLIDDGVATGLTMRAALRELRAENPTRLIVVVPAAHPEVAEEIRKEADGIIVLDPDEEYLGTVGAYYGWFPQVSDEEVIELLKR